MGRKKGKGRAVKRARQKFGAHYENEDLKLAPHSMVIHRGDVSKDIKALVSDVRRVMEPFTASELKSTKRNSLKDFVSIAGPLHVTHLMIFNQSELEADHMKLIRLPRGPTLHFNLLEYSLKNDVLSTMKKKQTHQKQYLHQPLLILNGFNPTTKSNDSNDTANKVDYHLKLLTATLQNMFPPINVTKVKLNEIRRCVLFNYNKDDETIDFRQYNIKLNPVGLSKPVKKLVQEKLPDMSNYQDISEFIEKGYLLSESEAEFDQADNKVELKEDMKMRGAVNLKSSTSAIRLSEIGPRLKLKLIKIEEGICEGQVLYHNLVKNSPEELQTLRENLKLKKKNKKLDKIANKKVKVNGKHQRKNFKKESNDEETEPEDEEIEGEESKTNETKSEDQLKEDAEYYKQELGEDPLPEFFQKIKKKKLKNLKRKLSERHADDDDDDETNPKNLKKLALNLEAYLDDKNDSNPLKPTSNKIVRFKEESTANNETKVAAKPKAKFLGFSKSKKKQMSNSNKN